MGLDMYLTGKTKDGQTEELGYWRKHPNLHGFMVRTFANGQDDQKPIPLTAERIRIVIQAILDQKLPQTTGFFFGTSYGDKEERDHDIRVFSQALAKILDHDYTVEYYAWW